MDEIKKTNIGSSITLPNFSDVNGINTNWLDDFNVIDSKSVIENINESFINDLSKKRENYLEILLKIKLVDLGINLYGVDLYDFFKKRVTRIIPESNSNCQEFILDFDEKTNSGKFIVGIIEIINFGSLEENKISASITFKEYNQSKFLKAV